MGRSPGADGGPKLVSMSIGMGPAFIDMGDIVVPTQLAFALRAGYPIRLGVLDGEAGAAFT